MDKIKKSSKAHTIYKTADGKRVPGATTVVGLLNKPALVGWANRLGLEGIDSTKYTDEAASVGTLAHAMIQADLTGEPIDPSLYSPQQIDLAENALISYYEYTKNHQIAPIICETPLVSEEMRYGGTVDCFCELDGVPTLLDFKTGKDIYPEYYVQLSAYKNILEEQGFEVAQCKILRVGRDETEGFEESTMSDTRKHFEIFKNLLNIYYLKKELKWS